MSPKVILITGVTSGIGLVTARLLWEGKHKVVATGRANSLTELSKAGFQDNERFLIRPLDLTRPEDEEPLFSEIRERWGKIDVLINNAAVSYRSVIEHLAEDELLHQMAVNFHAPIRLIRRVIPEMRSSRSGKIINVSSVGGMMAMPTMGAYSASKFALEGAMEALWYELKPWNVNVTLVQPGFVRSTSYQRVIWSTEAARAKEDTRDAYHNYYSNMEQFIGKLMSNAISTPEKVAQTVINLIDNPNPPLRLPVSADAHFFSWFRRVLPRRLYHWMLFRNLPGIKTWGK